MSPTSEKPRNPILPSYQKLCLVAGCGVAPVIALLLLAGRFAFAASVLAGWGIGIAIYAMLYAFVTQGTDIFALPRRGGDAAAKSGAAILFLCLMLGKFVVIGALMFVLVRHAHVNLIGLAIGFLVTQTAMTMTALIRLKRRPLIE